MFDFIGFRSGALAFLLAFVVAGLFTLAFKVIYQVVTPYRERELIRQGNSAASIALAGALIGYVLPLASALAHTVSLLEFAAWATLAGVIQILAFTVVRMVAVPDVKARIEAGETSIGIYLAAVAVAVGVLNAACMTLEARMNAPSKRKRSSSLTLTTMLAGASLTMVACDDAGSPAQWDQPQRPRAEQVEAFPYASLEACKTADEVPDGECDTAYAAALKDNETNAPRYAARSTCEDVYGDGNCVPRSAAGGGGHFFTPLLAGFVIGRMLDGGGGGYYRGTGLYHDRYGYDRGGLGYRTGWGGELARDYRTGRTIVDRQGVEPPASIRQAPPRVQTRTSVVSRGGFGGGRGHSFGG